MKTSVLKKLTCLAAFQILSTAAGWAQTENNPIHLSGEDASGLVRYTRLFTTDEVDGDCWTNSNSVESKIRLLFEQNDVQVLDYTPAFLNAVTVSTNASAFGFRANSGLCVVSARLQVQTYVYPTYGGYEGGQEYSTEYQAILHHQASVFSSGSNVNAQLTDFFEGAAASFMADVLSARRSGKVRGYFDTYPAALNEPMSLEKWNELVNAAASDN